jgi:hypothetical protein
MSLAALCLRGAGTVCPPGSLEVPAALALSLGFLAVGLVGLVWLAWRGRRG